MSQTTNETPSPHSWQGFVQFTNWYDRTHPLSSDKVQLLHVAVSMPEEDLERAFQALADVTLHRGQATTTPRHRPANDSPFNGSRVLSFPKGGAR